MPLRKVLFAQTGLPQELREYIANALAGQDSLQLEYIDTDDPAALIAAVAGADVIVGWRLSPEAIAAAERITLWIFPGAGVQSLIEPLRELNRQHAVVLVNSHSNAYAVAQHAVALLLSLSNRLVLHHNWMAAGRWRTGDAEAASMPLKGKCVGLLGYGRIGRQAHRLLAGFEMEFGALKRGWEGVYPAAPGLVTRYEPAGLAGLFEWSNAVIVALPSTPETKGLIGSKELARLGERGLLINVARGNIVDEEALYKALRNGVIGGAGIDVWYDYRPEPDAAGRVYPYRFPFHELPNVVLSPHRAASPLYVRERWADVIDNLRRYAEGREPVNVVDLEAGY